MIKESVRLGARTLELETGRIARQAHGSVLVREGDAVILATAVYAPEAARDVDFLPLTVDYREYMSAAGRIPGGFLRREGRASDRAVLASRLCDRSVRPLFPKGYRIETQVISTVLSHGTGSDAPVLAMIAAAAALHLSEIPWQGPLAAVRIARADGTLQVMPSTEMLDKAELDLVVSLSREGLVMIEGGARQVPDDEMLEALTFAQEAVQPLLDAMDKLRSGAGKPKATLKPPAEPVPALAALEKSARGRLTEALAVPDKLARRAAVRTAQEEALAAFLEDSGADEDNGNGLADAAASHLDALEGRILREQVLREQRRVDGRGAEDIRPISIEVDWLPGTHGSALFTRGETQAMVSLTLGTQQDRMLVESLEGVSYERFMLHYNFPPYSVGEVRPMRGPGRREVGHGTLARRALVSVMPGEDEFAYTVRVLSEISESNGSSSMATVCGGCLALMDGGVPIAAPVAGIAMGLVAEGDQFVVLSDILGDEDHLGDMDFKVAGTAQGVTALQMDNKIGSLPQEVLARAFEQARRGRLHILAEMEKVLPAPRADMKPNAPVISSLSISPQRVRELIGPGGRVIQELQRTHGVRIEVDEAGQVRIYASNRDSAMAAREAVMEVAGSLDVGAVYEGVVTGVKEFGAFVRIRGQDGLVHISEWDSGRVEKMSDVTKEGDVVRVKVLVPDRQGRLSLSRKAAM
ncbi:MAG TPA: polyribonucleotide nucleotidyltransferase [bacterium]|nr:polyribonucleotide nucleotidyltransferase [bacterium]